MLDLGELALQRRPNELRQGTSLLVDLDVDTAIGADPGIGTKVIVVFGDGAGDLRICRERLVWDGTRGRIVRLAYVEAMVLGCRFSSCVLACWKRPDTHWSSTYKGGGLLWMSEGR